MPYDPEEENRLTWTPQYTAYKLGTAVANVYALVDLGKLGCLNFTTHKRIPVPEVERFMREELNTDLQKLLDDWKIEKELSKKSNRRVVRL